MRRKLLNIKTSARIFAVVLMFAKTALSQEGDEAVVKNFSVDKENKTISYCLTKPATVRIRVGSKSGPLYRTLVNWHAQEEGNHVVEWDGMDTSGTFDILDNKNFTFSFNYYLSGEEDNTIEELLEAELVITDYFIGRVPRLVHTSQKHKNHKREHCKDIDVVFDLPPDSRRSEEGFPKIEGIVPIMLRLPQEDKAWFRRERFGINIYIDGVFVDGEALGYTPYTWNFNTKGINEGRHLITVNIKGFNDHMAAGSLPVYIEAAK